MTNDSAEMSNDKNWHGLGLPSYIYTKTTMANHHAKQIGNQPKEKPVTTMDTLHDTWRVMKPFVRFSFKALKVLAGALVFIVKHIPKPEKHKAKEKRDKVIKIK